ncbi:hypothetical protein MPER_11134 [Moniliophthora perniciosa FA553]|nr:hypothetical protein MPER_11134 [Moniliophthora perniciosa FA553]
MLKSAKIQETVPWHPINPPIFNREHRGKLKCHIGPSSDKVCEHMLKDCKDREQYQKLAADAKVEPDDADVEWESSVEVEEGDDLNITAKTLSAEASIITIISKNRGAL